MTQSAEGGMVGAERLALKRFQNCSMTKAVKNIDSSCVCIPPPVLKQWMRYMNITANIATPIPIMPLTIE